MKNSSLDLVLLFMYCLLKFVHEIEYQSSWAWLDLTYCFHKTYQQKMFSLLFNTFYKTVDSVKTSSEDKLDKQRALLFLLNYDFGIRHRQYIVFPGGFTQLYNKLLQDPNLSFEDKMRFEICRLASFSLAPNSFRGCQIKLAKGGFYYIQESNICKCAFCGIVKDDWEYSDNTDEVHRGLNPNCPFLNEGPEGSLETNYSIENGDNRQQTTLNLQAFMESPAVSHNGYVSRSQSALSLQNQVSALFPQYELLNNRKTSFGRWTNSALSPDRLAEAGFFYTGCGDWVTCAFCGIKLSNWRADCEPLIEHAHSAPECRFIRKKGNLFIQLVQSINLRSSLLSVEESTDTLSMTNGNRQAFKTYPKPRYPEYSQMRDRIRTFHGWSGHSSISQKEMAKSGLFYTGIEDRVICFFCGICLYQWEEGDEPFVAHAHYASECPYIRQIALNDERTISGYIMSRNHQVETIEEQERRLDDYRNIYAVEILSLMLEQESEESTQLSNDQPPPSNLESSNLTSNNEDQSQPTNGSHIDACQFPEDV